MIFLCPMCSGELEQTGQVRYFVCSRCKCTYEVKLEFKQVPGFTSYDNDIRQLSSANPTPEPDGQ